MNKADMWRGAAIIGGVIVIALLLLPRVAGSKGGDVILPSFSIPDVIVPENNFSFPDFDWEELILPGSLKFGNQPGYSPASCACGCEDKTIAFDTTWLDAVSAGITEGYREMFSRYNFMVPQTVQTLIATGGVRAYSQGGPF